MEGVGAEGIVLCEERVWGGEGEGGDVLGGFFGGAPAPGIAEPEHGDEVEGGWEEASVVDGDADEDVFGVGFGVFDEDVEVGVVVEGAGFVEFEFAVEAGAVFVEGAEGFVGEGGVRVFVEAFGVGVGWGGVEVVPSFFGVFAVVAFGVGEAEEAFFEDGVVSVPEGDGEAEASAAVAEAEDAFFAPAVGAVGGVVVGEVVPCVAVWGVVFADGAPLAFGEVGAPAAPVFRTVFGFGEAIVFWGAVFGGGHGMGLWGSRMRAWRGGELWGRGWLDFAMKNVAL